MDYPHLFSPFRIKNTVFRNRIFAAPNSTKHKSPLGFPEEMELALFESRAMGGAAVVTTGNSSVTERWRDQSRSRSLGFEDPDGQATLSELALGIRRHGAVASVELNHPGPMAMPVHSGGRDPIGPMDFVRGDGVHVQAMDESMIEDAIESFAKAARYAQECHFQMCMIHGGHGWLISSFLSAHGNQRTDRWGGSTENRARLAIAICDRIHQVCGEDFLIEFRMSGNEFVEGGMTVEEAIRIAKLLEGHVDLLHISAAGLSTAHHNNQEAHDPKTAAAIWSNCPTPHIIQPQGCYVPIAEAIKKAGVKTPIVTVGAITTPEMAEEIIADGKADFVAMARALIADPELPKKAKAGQREEITPCIRCDKCNDRRVSRLCTVNPSMGRYIRHYYTDKPVESKRVAVIGGGPGGMEAAITAAKRGHDVTLYEKESVLGGKLNQISREYLKREMVPYRDFLVRETNKRVHVVLNARVTHEMLATEGYDWLILAVGAAPVIPPIPGVDRPNVYHALQARDEGTVLGDTVAIIGGGVAGCELAWELAREGKQVHLIEQLPTLALERDKVCRNYNMPILAGIQADLRIQIHCSTSCRCITDSGVEVAGADGTVRMLPADSVLLSVGLRPEQDTVDTLWSAAPNCVPIGDCVQPRFIMDAVSEGFFAAMDL